MSVSAANPNLIQDLIGGLQALLTQSESLAALRDQLTSANAQIGSQLTSAHVQITQANAQIGQMTQVLNNFYSDAVIATLKNTAGVALLIIGAIGIGYCYYQETQKNDASQPQQEAAQASSEVNTEEQGFVDAFKAFVNANKKEIILVASLFSMILGTGVVLNTTVSFAYRIYCARAQMSAALAVPVALNALKAI